MTASPLTGLAHPLTQGFLLCVSIIIAFGPQNLFILRQGLKRQHLFVTALVSALADVVLISMAVGGLSALISTSVTLQTVVTIAGISFLIWCGSRSLVAALRSGSTAIQATQNSTASGIVATIVAALSFAFLNPAAYLDTLVIIGSKSLFFSIDDRLIFAIGAVLASTFWFFTLVYGASKLSPIFRSPLAWRTLDTLSGCIMLGIGVTMLTTCQLPL